jgi:hypothetical protein
MGAAAANAGASPESCGGQRHGTEAMGGYELVRSDDAPAAAIAVDLEAGGTTAPCGDDYPKRRRGSSTPSPPAPASTRPQRLVSLDVFRGITVLVRTTNHSHLSSSLLPPLLAPSLLPAFFFLNKPPSCFLIQWLAIRLSLNSLLLPNRNQIELLAEWGSLLAADRLSAAMVLMPTTHVHG